MARSGQKTKDKSLTQNEKKIRTPEETRELAMIEAQAEEDRKAAKAKDMAERRERERLAKLEEQESGRSLDADDPEIVDKYQMLQDMRWLYKKKGGRKSLEAHMALNPKDYYVMVRELMKLEAGLKALEIKSKAAGNNGGSGRAVLVVIKGLHETSDTPATATKIDIESMHSVLNPADVIQEELPVAIPGLSEGGEW